MKRLKPYSPLWNYLTASGVLETGNDEAIRAAKKEYRKAYLANYKRTRRASHSEYVIICNPRENKIFIEAAKKHNLIPVRYIKQSSLAYTNQTHLVPDIATLHHILQTLLTCKSTIQQLAREKSPWYKRNINYETLVRLLTDMQQTIQTNLLNKPVP